MNENFEKQLEFIVDCRKRNRRNGYVLGFLAMPLLLLAVLMPMLQFLLVPIMMLVFGQEKIDQLKEIEKFWFYSFIVWGVFLQTMREELDKPFNKRVN